MNEMYENRVEISLLLPVCNEAETIERVITEFYNEIGTKIPIEIIVAEDGSTDGTKEVLLQLSEKIPMKLIMGDKKKGYFRGVKDSLRLVNSEYIFFTDSDGQHIPSDFWKLYNKRHEYDLIVGKKIQRQDPPDRILMSEFFHKIVQLVFGLPVHQPNTGYRIIRKEVVDSVLEEVRILEYGFWTEFTIRAYKKGFKVTEIPVVHRLRLAGSSRNWVNQSKLRIAFQQIMGLINLKRELERAAHPLK